MNVSYEGGLGNDTYRLIKTSVFRDNITITDTDGTDTIDIFEDLRPSANSGIANVTQTYHRNADGSLSVLMRWTEYGIQSQSELRLVGTFEYIRDHGIGEDGYEFDVRFQLWGSNSSPIAPQAGVQATLGFGSLNADSLNGTATKDFIYGFGGADTIRGGSGNDIIQGGDGNDLIIGGAGDDQLHGDGGQDNAVYSSYRSDYVTTKIGNAVIISDKVSGRDGRDTLSEIERVAFADGYLVFDVLNSNAPQAYRLYGGAFNRTPDENGFRYWANILETGVSMNVVAASFIASDEFTARYGSQLSNAAFVDALYQNVLHRPGETAGVAYWNEVLDKQLATRADVLVSFTQLPEYVGLSAANIDNGYWVV